MAFKSYFDGGNEADSTQYKIVTLAAFSGCQVQWQNFDRQWKRALANHGAPYLHTTDAIALSGDFSKRAGWGQEKVDSLLSDCSAVVKRCSATRTGGSITALGVRAHTISVVLKDYIRAKSENPKLWTVPHICAVQCVNCCFNFAHALGTTAWMQLFFDRNEPYYSHIKDRFTNKKSKAASPGWERVGHLGQSNMRMVPALQAADMLAWAVNREYEEGSARYEWQRSLLAVDRDPGWYDYDRLRNPIHENIDAVNSWRLPSRKPMR